jgi:hypothetical protein
MLEDHGICYDHLPNGPGATEKVAAEEMTMEVSYQQRVLAHLRASLTLPNAQAVPMADVEPMVDRASEDQYHGLQSATMQDVPRPVVPAERTNEHPSP